MNKKILACDFETTVYAGQESTEVWASAVVELNTEVVKIFHSIDETWEYLCSLNQSLICYYHNLKFDGNFWISYFLNVKHYKQAYEETDGIVEWKNITKMVNYEFKYLISNMGQWYSITIKVGKHTIEFRDSLKLLPFTLERIGEAFKTKHRKLTMEYEGYRYAGCNITSEEQEYIANDVLVLKEALEFMFSQGNTKMTIGSCCLAEYKHMNYEPEFFNTFMPDLTAIGLDESYGSENADVYIRKSYKGGWCYVAKGKECKVKTNGITVDVNSLYPSMMHSESGNWYPVSTPHFFKGELPDEAKDTILFNGDMSIKYWFIRFRCRFKIKEGKLPFVQIKYNLAYRSNECLESSDVYIKGKYYKQYHNPDGTLNDGKVTLTMTKTDFILFREHYYVYEIEYLDGCWFYTEKGLFDSYINKYREIKMNSKGAMRELAKLFLNNLYGKLATSTNSSFKLCVLKEDGSVGFVNVKENNKKAGFIAIGAAITSYARNFTIRAAQKNYYGADKRGFIYADTDSIHCDLREDELKGVTLHPTNFNCWKIESNWDVGFFTRQKTYIEHIVIKDGNKLEIPYYDIKCAGMPPRCKYLFNLSMGADPVKSNKPLTEEEQEFVNVKRTITDFKEGLQIPGKLLPKRIRGGVVLTDTTFEIR